MNLKQLPSFICFAGPDGVGKTTQAKLLQKKLEKAGVKQKYVWLRYSHKISLLPLAFARIFKLSRVKELKKGKIVCHEFYKSRPMSTLYEFTLLVDMFFSVLMKVRIPILLGKVIICDRFVPDTLVDLMVSTKNFDLFDNIIWVFFVTLIPEGKIIMLKARAEDLRHRRDDLKADEDLELKIRAYDIIASKLNITAINSDKPISSIHNEIMEILLPQVGYFGA